MENIDNLLEEYRAKGEAALVKEIKDYPSFGDMERDYCNLINEGNSIRNLILQTPECCDDSTRTVLNNELEGFTEGLRGKFKTLTLVFLLSEKLYKIYKEKLEEAKNNNDDNEYININEQLFRFSKKYVYHKNIADLLYQKYKNFKQAMELYKEMEPVANEEDIEFWNNYAELNAEYDNSEKQKYCLTKKKIAQLKKDIKTELDNKEYKQAIKKYEELFKTTNDYSYKKDIANVYAIFFQDIKKAIKIYKSIEQNFENDANYWFQLSSLYEYNNNYYQEVLCIKKAIDIELKEPEGEV